ncbi:hypothetical protein [uncultured Corynebacterium sp.]|uniref:hypothetical protein n=1 Tax=uncultured Corynebacterium sp. TaxID=159447 RepID=UPI0025DC372A|nr:hypothetical protein [uncultured Corynebacterium sp.]
MPTQRLPSLTQRPHVCPGHLSREKAGDRVRSTPASPATSQSEQLGTGLKPRHVTMLSPTGTIGAGLFVGSATAIHLACHTVTPAYTRATVTPAYTRATVTPA